MEDRMAHIITENGITCNFDLNSGVLQGNTSSPIKFRFAINPLLVMLEIEPQISLPPEIDFELHDTDEPADTESAFADDIDVYMESEPTALTATKNILDSFYNTSSLKINANKTKLCIVGRPASPEFTQCAENFGFSFVTEFTMLGITFDHKLENMNQNIDKCIRKMNNIRNFFAFFNLTLPGKIYICKSYILPQISYVGSILTFSDDYIEIIENLIYNFVNQHETVARSKIFSEPQEGGLGIPKIKPFLQSLDCLLFKKSLFIKDTWSTQLRNFAVKNDKFYFAKNCNIEDNPILHRIINSYTQFSLSFWLNHNNVHDMRIFNNIHIRDSLGQKITKRMFARNTWENFGDNIIKLKIKNILKEDKSFPTHAELNTLTNINFDNMDYWYLNQVFTNCLEDLKIKINLDCTVSLQRFMMNKDLKSKDFRVFLRKDIPKINEIATTIHRYNWAGVNPVDSLREIYFQSVWKTSYLPIDVRDFSLRFVNNYIKLNANIGRWDPTQTQDCTFCTQSYVVLGAAKEKYPHFFGICNITKPFATSYFNGFLEKIHFDFSIEWLLLGAPSVLNKNLAEIIIIEIMFLNFFLYRCRNKKKKPLLNDFHNFMSWNRKILLKNNAYKRNFKRLNFVFDNG